MRPFLHPEHHHWLAAASAATKPLANSELKQSTSIVAHLPVDASSSLSLSCPITARRRLVLAYPFDYHFPGDVVSVVHFAIYSFPVDFVVHRLRWGGAAQWQRDRCNVMKNLSSCGIYLPACLYPLHWLDERPPHLLYPGHIIMLLLLHSGA